MEKKVKKELLELCRSIMNDTEDDDLISSLTKTQMLYEKLVVLNYLREQGLEEEEEMVNPQEQIDNSDAEENEIIDLYEAEMKEASPAIDPKDIEPVLESKREAELEVVPRGDVETRPKEEALETDTATDSKGQSINSKFGSQTLKIGLNDRIAFVKHLFNGEQEDYNRVLSQLNTFADYEEALAFIEQMIKPDYDWDTKEEYEDRFMELVRARFGIE